MSGRCQSCGVEPVLALYPGHIDHLCYYCQPCDRIATRDLGYAGPWVPKADLPANTAVEQLPRVNNGWQPAPCQVCGTVTKLQWHHLAPRALMPNADQWPQVWTCDQCHMSWHDCVTPGLVSRSKTWTR